MLSCAEDLVDKLTEGSELFVLKIGKNERLVSGEDLRLHKGNSSVQGNEKIYCSSLHLLILGISVVAVLVERRVEIHLLCLLRGVIDRRKSLCHRLSRRAERACYALKSGDSFSRFSISLFPILASCENMRKIPHKFGIHIFS